jgi:hypothetical protein
LVLRRAFRPRFDHVSGLPLSCLSRRPLLDKRKRRLPTDTAPEIRLRTAQFVKSPQALEGFD